MPDEQKAEKQVPIKWDIPDDEGPVHISNMLVQHTDHEFLVRFFQVYPPLLLGTDEEKEEQAKEIKHVEARCVGQYVLAPERIQKFIDALTTNLGRWNAKQKQGD